MPVAQHRLASFVTRQWQRRGWFARMLWPLSLLFGAASGLRRRLFRWGWLRSVRLPVPVVVVGNVTVGGAGKTPAVIALASALADAGPAPRHPSRAATVRRSSTRARCVSTPARKTSATSPC